MSNKTLNRAKKILDLLLQDGRRSIEELTLELSISPASVRRDLTSLEQRGLVKRTHGGAELSGTMTYEAFKFDAAFPLREERFSEEKRRIALAAAELVSTGQTIALGPGTTMTQVARSLKLRENIHVVTSALNIGMELSSITTLQLTMTGGSMRWPGAYSMVGAATLELLDQFFFDVAIIGVCGVHPSHGVTVIQPDEASVLKRMFLQSRRKVVVADSSKVGATSPVRVCKMQEIDTIITDNSISPQLIQAFEKLQIEVIVV